MGGSSKKVTVGYKYYLGMHLILCHGPIDRLLRIRVDGKDAWIGDRNSGAIVINNENLFGGESREGGISGVVDFEPGGPGQGQNSYLVSQLGSMIPAYRGVVGAVLRQVYVGLNPYLKKWAFRAQRIHIRQNGVAQWYYPKAEIKVTSNFKVRQMLYFALDKSGSMNTMAGGQTRMTIAKNQLKAVLDAIDRLRIDSKVQVDICVQGWSDSVTSMTRYNVQTSDVEDLKTFIQDMTPNPSGTGGTNFAAAFSSANSFFQPSATDSRRRALFFITDGEPFPLSSVDDAVSAYSDLLNRTGIWTQNPVDVFAVNIDLDNTAYTALVDNTPQDGVPVVDSAESNAMYNAVFFAVMGDSSAMNPAHIIRECLTDPDWGMGYADTEIDDKAFMLAADQLHKEQMGISILWDRQTSIEDFIGEIIKHIDAVLYVDRKSGLFTLRLVRGGYDKETLIHLNEDNIDKIENFTRPAFGELTNSVTVNYWNVNTGNEASVTAQDIALQQMQQVTIGTTLQYPGFVDPITASKVAQRDLNSLSSQRATCTIYADRTAKNLAIGDVFKLSWEDYNLSEVVMRVTGIAYGDGRTNRIKITCTEDVFDLPQTSFVTPEPPAWEDPNVTQAPLQNRLLFEIPYLELVQRLGQADTDAKLTDFPEVGYLGAAAARPNAGTLNARMFVDRGAGYEEVAALDFSPSIELAADVGQLDTVWTVSGPSDLDMVPAGSWAQVGEELVYVSALSATEMTVKRGVLDTTPVPHAEGSRIVFWDAYAASDEVEYASGEEVQVKLSPVTGVGQLSIESTPADSLTFAQRALRPYPPGNVKFDGEYFPTEIIGNADVVVTFATRNRLQQTGGLLVGFTDGDITSEPGVDYLAEAYQAGTNDLLWTGSSSASPLTIPANALTSVPSVDFRLYSRKGSLLSFQPVRATFSTGGLSVAWEPSMLPNLVAWYDADSPDNTLVSGLMDTLYDRSGNGNHAPKWNNDSTNRAQMYDNALNGRRVWGYDTTSRKAFFASAAAHVKAAGNLAHGLSIFTVSATVTDQGTSDAGTVASLTIGTSNSSTRCQVARGFVVVNGIYTGGRRLDTDANANTSDSVNYGTGYRIAGGVNDYLNRRSTLYVDGAQVAQNTTFQTIGYTSATDAQFFLVGGTGSGVNPHRGRTAEVVLCRGALPDDDRQKLEGYLAHRWGLAAQLPAGHPYKAAAPTVNLIDGELPPNLIAPRAITEAP